MGATSLDLTGKVEPLVAELLADVMQAAKREAIDFFVVGAAARDLVLEHGYGMKSRRATRDVDLACRLADWGAYQRLVEALKESGRRARSPGRPTSPRGCASPAMPTCEYERLTGASYDVLGLEGYHLHRGGVRLLGRDMAAIMRPETRARVLAVLAAESEQASGYRLALAIAGSGAAKEDFDSALQALDVLRTGIEDIPLSP